MTSLEYEHARNAGLLTDLWFMWLCDLFHCDLSSWSVQHRKAMRQMSDNLGRILKGSGPSKCQKSLRKFAKSLQISGILTQNFPIANLQNYY